MRPRDSQEGRHFGVIHQAPSHLSVVGSLLAGQQTQNVIILLLVFLLAGQGILLHEAKKRSPITVYGVDAAGQAKFLGDMSAYQETTPSKQEVAFVARRFASLLHDRNSSTIRENLRQAIAMCAPVVQRQAQLTWQNKEVSQQVRDEQVRTELSWNRVTAESTGPQDWQVRLRGQQALFPLSDFDAAPWKTQQLHVEVSLRQRPREPIHFPSGLEVVGYTILDRRASSAVQE